MRTVSGRRLPPNIGRENIAVYTGRSLSGREMEEFVMERGSCIDALMQMRWASDPESV